MAASFGILCPGQGGQHLGMFDLARSDRTLSTVLDQWLDESLGGRSGETWTLTPEHLSSGITVQPLIVAATLIVWHGLALRLPPPALVAGYSIGEVAASSIVGALPPVRAVKLAAIRARHMQHCADITGTPQAMLAVSGLTRPAVASLCQRFDAFINIVNGPDAFVVAGPAERLNGLQADATAQGASVRRLPVSVASHTPLMRQAAAMLDATLSEPDFIFAQPSLPLAAGVDGSILCNADALRRNLVRQLHEPLDWAVCMESFAERGITTILELGPGDALARMIRNSHPAIDARAASDFRSVEGISKWMKPRLLA